MGDWVACIAQVGQAADKGDGPGHVEAFRSGDDGFSGLNQWVTELIIRLFFYVRQFWFFFQGVRETTNTEWGLLFYHPEFQPYTRHI